MTDGGDLLRRTTTRFADVVEAGDLDAPIAHCPGWRLRDLVDHLGGIHQWARHAVLAGSPDLEPAPAPDLATTDAATLVAWYRGHAADLIDVLSTRPSGSPAWTMDPTDPTVGFWGRRQVHETRLHLWDAELTLGEPTPYEPELAWDGVLEVVEMFWPRQLRLGRATPIRPTLRLVATDGPWSVVLGEPDEHPGAGPVEVRATAEVLLRLLWHRADPWAEGVDPQAVTVLTTTALTP